MANTTAYLTSSQFVRSFTLARRASTWLIGLASPGRPRTEFVPRKTPARRSPRLTEAQRARKAP